MRSPGGWKEPGQTPEFEQYTLVLKGVQHVADKDGSLDVRAGHSVIVHAGEWVPNSTLEPRG
jgi:mannose-6-phosphate isomerase-like protein (cupin superfamily)